jgi:hypothetical protein
MQAEGFPITLWRYAPLEYYQGAISTHAMRLAFAKYRFDWCFLLDADEFLTSPRRAYENVLGALPPNTLAGLKWRTFVPVSNGYFRFSNPLFRMFKPRATEVREMIKVVVPRSLADSVILSEGNHNVCTPGVGGKVLDAPPLDHAPIRSPEQLLAKVMINSRKKELKTKRERLEGFHLFQMAESIRRSGFRINDAQMTALARTYCQFPGEAVADIDFDARPLGLRTDRIRYRDMCQVNLLERLDGFIGNLVEAIKERRADHFTNLSPEEALAEAAKGFIPVRAAARNSPVRVD